ncbi:nitrate ABC transporter substrate-binding protein [Dickeya dianthicola]|uniref:nitrate ABC transporter substrate-binding protein n=1 Tax=Dickeya dianthicola TaxID=204039 RepID=UPI00039C2E7C|nr:nitrate ABC transporter substrate-binding protein [Dickeya dianthicola]ATO35033.1 4,5-dihydroxyphthalate decarboxylase [Dickeya dianthicola RNS04.9]MCA7005622.1 nitrate ABC transporter substrate-binding protein [Dickeya dianthicola]MCI4155553.1 nitrate ABC transporter substrate-binding protein [Dickeya dianthicola]MCI4203372.1 nitrate ABC transporter substrate-binding protein [Dickeya dianthicola]MCI4213959.1 nitrate ABC transporter substrate-binding protein [Dickeya dianthicola]
MITIRLAVRDWDYFTPLALGDVRSERFNVEVHRVNTLVDDLATSEHYDAGEVSFSRYAQARAKGDTSLLGVPHFLMRGFRQRCIITTADNPVTSLEQLKGGRIGVTGWQDSGNTWTRTLLREAGVGIEDVRWFAGRLTADHPIVDRLGRFGRPGHIEAAPGERPLIELLQAGELDAVFTPFMPQGFFLPGSGLRQVQADFRQAELAYFRRVGYVPGIHMLGIKPALVASLPWLPGELSRLIDRSAQVWQQKREKYADTTPWLLDDLRRTAQDLPANWNDNGFDVNCKMIADFGRELYEQDITDTLLTPEAIFPAFVTQGA